VVLFDVMKCAGGADGPLIGRGEELHQVGDLLKAASGGSASSVFLTGEAGIGKTALLSAILDQAEGLGFSVGRACGSRLEGELRFGVVRRLFEAPLAALEPDRRAAVLAEAGEPAPMILAAGQFDEPVDEAGFEGHHVLYRLMAALANEGPLLFAVDDVHLADASSVQFLAYAARRLTGLPIALVCCATDGETRLAPLSFEELAMFAHTFVLEPLTEQQTAEVIRLADGECMAQQAASVCSQVVNGNPFLLRALLVEIGRWRRCNPEELIVSNIVELGSSTVAERLFARFHGDPDAIELARAVTVLGDHAEFNLAAAVADLNPVRAAHALDTLVRMRILENSSPLRFRHVLVRNALFDDMPIGARLTRHARAAGYLHDVQADAEAVAAHLLNARVVDFDWAADTLHSGGVKAVRRGAPEVAFGYLRHALLQSANRDQRAAIMLDLGDVEMASDPAAGITRLRTALAEATTTTARSAAAVVLRLAPALLELNSHREARAIVDGALAALRLDDEPDLTWHLRSVSAFISWSQWGTTRHGQAEERQLFGEVPAVGECQAGHAHIAATCARQGHSRERILSWGWQVLADLDLMVFCQPHYSALFGLIVAEDDEYTRKVCQSADRLARSGLPFTSAISLMILGSVDSMVGNLPSAQAHLSSALEMFDEWDVRGASARSIMCVAGLAEVLAISGGYEAAQLLLADRQLTGDLPHRVSSTFVLYARGQLRLGTGDIDAAIEDFVECGWRAEEWSLLNPAVMRWRSQLATAYLAKGDPARAREMAEEELGRARRWGTNRSIGIATHVLGMTYPPKRRASMLVEAVALLRKSPAKLALSLALLDLAKTARQNGETEAAVEYLEQADALAAWCGAKPVVAQVKEQLAACTPAGSRLGSSGLTKQERRTTMLAVAGMTNRLIAAELWVSQRCVEAHLTSAYRKLGISRRSELSSALARNDKHPSRLS